MGTGHDQRRRGLGQVTAQWKIIYNMSNFTFIVGILALYAKYYMLRTETRKCQVVYYMPDITFNNDIYE